MSDYLDATGLHIDDLATRRADKVAALRAAISDILDVSPDQPIGQVTDIVNEREQSLVELLQDLYSTLDPQQASGQGLDAVCSLTGTYRREATRGTVTLSLDLNAAVTVPAGSQVAVDGDPDNIWETTAAVTSIGAGVYPASARCVEAGVYQAPAGSLTVIVTPVAGWNSSTNASDATAGDARETDTALRLRRSVEVQIGGSTSVDALRAAISQVDGIEEVFVYENDKIITQDGMPPKSVEVVYWDGSPAGALTSDIGAEIFAEKAGGVQAFGTNIETVTDAQNNAHQIGMTRADEQVIVVEIDIDDGPNYVGDAAVAQAIENWAEDNLGIGEDVYRSKISGVAINLDGVENVSQVQLSISPAPVGAADITITSRQIATIAIANITVNS